MKIVFALAAFALGGLSLLFLVWGVAAFISTFREGPAGKDIAVALLVVPGVLIGGWALSLWRRVRPR